MIFSAIMLALQFATCYLYANVAFQLRIRACYFLLAAFFLMAVRRVTAFLYYWKPDQETETMLMVDHLILPSLISVLTLLASYLLLIEVRHHHLVNMELEKLLKEKGGEA